MINSNTHTHTPLSRSVPPGSTAWLVNFSRLVIAVLYRGPGGSMDCVDYEQFWFLAFYQSFVTLYHIWLYYMVPLRGGTQLLKRSDFKRESQRNSDKAAHVYHVKSEDCKPQGLHDTLWSFIFHFFVLKVTLCLFHDMTPWFYIVVFLCQLKCIPCVLRTVLCVRENDIAFLTKIHCSVFKHLLAKFSLQIIVIFFIQPTFVFLIMVFCC